MNDKKTIGIDFGTTKTIVAYYDEQERRPRSIHLGRNDAIPTTLYVASDKHIEIGDEADDNRALDWNGYVRRIKRDLGRYKTHVLNGHQFSTVNLISVFLQKVLEKVEAEALYAKPDHVVVTVPAEYGRAKRDELEQGIRAAGITSFELIEEPVAAAAAWLALNTGSHLGQRVMVFDWGGGTLDVAVLERDGDGYRSYPSLIGGDENLGGEDIDDCLIDGIDQKLREGGFRATAERCDRERDLITKRVTEAKVQHSRKNEVRWSFALEDMKEPYTWNWNREEFNEWIRERVDRAVNHAKKVFESAQREKLVIDQIILIGGSSRLPLVSTRLKEVLGREPLRWDRSIEAVAYGAAIKAHKRGGAIPPRAGRPPKPDLVDKKTTQRPPPPMGKENRSNKTQSDSTPILSIDCTLPTKKGEDIKREYTVTTPFGHGYVKVEGRPIQFVIPHAFSDGDIITIAGEGEAGYNGSPNGNLQIYLRKPSTEFQPTPPTTADSHPPSPASSDEGVKILMTLVVLVVCVILIVNFPNWIVLWGASAAGIMKSLWKRH